MNGIGAITVCKTWVVGIPGHGAIAETGVLGGGWFHYLCDCHT